MVNPGQLLFSRRHHLIALVYRRTYHTAAFLGYYRYNMNCRLRWHDTTRVLGGGYYYVGYYPPSTTLLRIQNHRKILLTTDNIPTLKHSTFATFLLSPCSIHCRFRLLRVVTRRSFVAPSVSLDALNRTGPKHCMY